MKCTNRKRIEIICLCILLLVSLILPGCGRKEQPVVSSYETAQYDHSLETGALFADQLCVSQDSEPADNMTTDTSLHAAGLFSISNADTQYAYQVQQQLEPASTTKIMTALLVIEKGNLDDVVTVSDHAVNDLEAGSSVCGLQPGDQLTLRDLLYGLLLESGNDSAVVIAEYVGGDETAFVNMMNQRAHDLGATHTNFVNPHGLHDDNHYTTAYDLYLIFNQCLQNDVFIQIIQSPSYNTSVTGGDGTMRSVTWMPTNYYASGEAKAPEGVTVIGGKTGTTDQAGSCLILYSENNQQNPYISVVMGGATKEILYTNMNSLLQGELQ